MTLEHAWTNPPSSTPDYLTEALRMKRSNLRRSASNGEPGDGDKATSKEKREGELGICLDTVRFGASCAGSVATRSRREEGVLQIHSVPLESSFPNVDRGIFLDSSRARLPNLGVLMKSIGHTILEITIANKEKPTSHQKSCVCCPVSAFLPGRYPCFPPGSHCSA